MLLASLVLSVVVGASPGAPLRLAQAEGEVAPELEEGEVLELDDEDDAPTPIDDQGRELEEGEVLELDDEQEIVLEGQPEAGVPAEAPAETPAAEVDGWEEFEQDLAAFLDGNWLDPPGEFWAVRRGGRLELSFFLGGEAAAGKIQPGDISVITDFGGVVLTPVARWYPVDQVAMVMGVRSFLGLGQEAAAGTSAQTVLTPFFGIRYDLVKEGRLSFLIDVYSGPAAFVFASLTDAETTAGLLDRVIPQWALGAEIGGALVGRYTLGPTTFELRGTVGGRAGSASDINRPSGEVGPFSAFYAGIDLGITWSFLADGKVVTTSNGDGDG
jgi:hypothetical protein